MQAERFIPKSNLNTLFQLRNVAIAGQLLVVCVVYFALDIEIPMISSLIVIGVMVLVNGKVLLALRSDAAISELRFFFHLLIDVGGLTAILYFNGGYTNPFVSLYLLPLAITAVILPAFYTWLLAAICVAGYTFLMFDYVSLPSYSGRFGNDFSLHTFGMWCSFVLSSIVICAFVVFMATALRQRDQRLAQARVEAQRNERVVALGALAAGTAHELGTPLSTMAVLIEELIADCEDDSDLRDDLGTLSEQIARCRHALTATLEEAGQPRAERAGRIEIHDYLMGVVGQWQRMRPDVNLQWSPDNIHNGVTLLADNTLDQALISVFNNAADASPDFVAIETDVRRNELTVKIEDRGCGFSDDNDQNFDAPYDSEKGPGRGLGLFLAKSVIERMGGRIRVSPNENNPGTTVAVTFPVVSQ